MKTGGRKKGTPNKVTANLKLLAGRHGREAIAAILEIARSAENEQTRLAAWRELLDRGYGKPAQYNEIGGGGSLQLTVVTGVPARAVQQIEPPIIDIEANGTDMLPAPDSDDTNEVGDD